MSTPRLILVAGASGSGKSRLARHSHCLQFRLDDFYLDEARVLSELARSAEGEEEADERSEEHFDQARVLSELSEEAEAEGPGADVKAPITSYGIIDWDDPAVWDAGAALEALRHLMENGQVEVPEYSIPLSRAVGRHTLKLDGRTCILAEGIFAIEMLGHLQKAGIPATAIYLDRPRWLVFLLRLRRDLALKRKPPLVLLRRGLALWKAQPDHKRRALAAGFTPLAMKRALAAVAP